MFAKNSLHQLFADLWDDVVAKYGDKIRPVVIESIEKMLWRAD